MNGPEDAGRDDRTRRIDPHDPDATRQVDPGATRRVEPPTGGSSMDADPTRQIDAVDAGYGDDDGYVTVPNRPPGETRLEEEEEVIVDEPPERNRARDWALGLGGVVVGVLLAVIVAFLAGGDDEPIDGDVAAAQDRIEALEAERDELQAQNDALEARAADAEAAAGEGDADLAAQREALDDRAAALDERTATLDRREGELDERARTLDERESQIERGEQEAPSGEADGGGDGDGDGGDGGIDLPDIDSEEVDGFIDRVLERIRDLF